MKKMTLQVGEATFDRIAQNPRLVKQMDTSGSS